jgi:hypothetical protein
MHQIIVALAAVIALLSAGAAGTTTHAGVRPAHANPPSGLRPMDIFPPTGL